MSMRWYNYSDDELIDIAMENSESLLYELARRLDEANQEIAKPLGQPSKDIEHSYEIESLQSEVWNLQAEVEELEAKLSNQTLFAKQAVELVKRANQALKGE